MGKAYKSGNPQDLNRLIWQEWYEFNNPDDIFDSLKKSSDHFSPKYKYKY